MIFACLLSLSCLVVLFVFNRRKPDDTQDNLRRDVLEELRASRQELSALLTQTLRSLGDLLSDGQTRAAQAQDQRLSELGNNLKTMTTQLDTRLGQSLSQMDARLLGGQQQMEQKLEQMRQTQEQRLQRLQQENSEKLEQMRQTVDEKLQKTLEERLGQSFQLVSTRLEEVYKGLGEMQTLAVGVGDLKRVLSNVKTRGTLGEVQLGAILEQILSPEQYAADVAVVPGARERVEYAVKLPGDGETPVYLPIDAKFPADKFDRLVKAYESDAAEEIRKAGEMLESTLKAMARGIREKYIAPPHTTGFGVLFLPVEGLYAEAVRRGLSETLYRDCRVLLAGPTTLAAQLSSLQMGFRTLAIQKRSHDVWRVLGAVKTEFSKFQDLLIKTQRNIKLAGEGLDQLVGVRTRKIESTLRQVEMLEEATPESFPTLGVEELPSAEDARG